MAKSMMVLFGTLVNGGKFLGFCGSLRYTSGICVNFSVVSLI